MRAMSQCIHRNYLDVHFRLFWIIWRYSSMFDLTICKRRLGLMQYFSAMAYEPHSFCTGSFLDDLSRYLNNFD